MLENRSPWLAELARAREAVPLLTDRATDVAIVGAGIAGAATAYFTLATTDKRVILIEGDRVAHGATGHNAGQVTSYFERPFPELVEEFGIERAAEGQRAIESAWGLLDQIQAEAKLQTPSFRFTGYTGLATFEQLTSQLETQRLRIAGGLAAETVFVARESGWLAQVALEYRDLVTEIPHDDLLKLLETGDREYHACVASQKGCMNSARFTEELVSYLLGAYPGRIELYEESPVHEVRLVEDRALLSVGTHTVEARRVVLCTNGFEYFTITNESGSDIDTEFHHLMNGRIGYMAGYLEPLAAPPTALSYFPKQGALAHDPTGDPYFYLTRRPHGATDTAHNLVCAGGPETVLPNQADYSRIAPCHEENRALLDEFLAATYQGYLDAPEYAFCWHGLMGYTPNGVRRAGVEPCNPVLLYNLGCNGVGILPSIYGGKRVAQLLAGETLPSSIFDPHDTRPLA